MISIQVTENDIIRAMRNPRYSPIQLAVSDILNVSPGDVDVTKDRIFVWSDDEDHETYILEGDLENFHSFLEEWEFYVEEAEIDFDEEEFVFQMSEKKFQEFA